MSKKLIALFAIVAALSIYAVVAHADDMKSGMGSWTGEVIDVKSKKIIARSGSFTESLLMKGRDFLRATEGEIAVFAKKVKKG